MGHRYVKEDETFNTSRNGTVPKPTGQDVTDNNFLRADGSWARGGGGSVVSVDQQISSGIEIGGVTIDGVRTAFYAPKPSHDYSETEHVVGKWIDGKPIYEKTISAGTLPDNTTKNVETLSSLKYLIDIEGFAYSSTAGNIRPLQFVGGSGSSNTNNIRVDVSNFVLRIITYNNTWTNYSAYLTIRYTKSTD